MTTITINRATAQQALEALGLAKLNGKAGLHPAEIGEIADAITALRTALAQQAEPVAGNTLLKAFLAAAKEAGVTHLRQVEAVLRAALAQQTEPVLDQTAYKAGLSDAMEQIYAEIDCVEMQYSDDPTRLNAARNALINAKQLIMDTLGMVETVQEPTEPVEPVAWRVQRSDGQYEVYLASAERASECYIKRPQIEPLYAAPPQRKPLTEEEIDALPWNGSPRQFARAVEKASWEKNHG